MAPRAPGDSVRPRRLAGVVVRPLNFTVRRIALMAADALSAALRIAFGALIGVIFALCLAAGIYFGWTEALVVICVGAAVGAYLGVRYGDRFFVWVLKFWNRPGD